MRIYIGKEQRGNENEPNDLCKVTHHKKIEIICYNLTLLLGEQEVNQTS